MYELFVTIGRITYNYGLFEAKVIDKAKKDLEEHFPNYKVFTKEKEYNILKFDDNQEILYS